MISPMTSGVPRDLPAAALSALDVAQQPGAGVKSATAKRAIVPAALTGAALAATSSLTAAKKKSKTKSTKKRSSAGYASAKKTSSSGSKSSSKAGGALAFLDDPRISTEEKLFRFMMYVTERYDRDIEQKMKEAAGGASAAGGSTTTKKKSSNPFSKIAGAIKTVFPAAGIALEALNNKNLQSLLKTFSGPALAAGATALGMPALAPILAKVGPQLAGVTFDLAKALNEPTGETATTSKSASSGSGSTSGTGDSPEVDRRKVMELQYAMEKQKEMFSLVSNILRSMHDMKMVAVQNVRS